MNASPKTWPYDTPEDVFLGRAVQRVGKALFGDDWSGGSFDEDDMTDNAQRLASIEAIGSAAAGGELVTSLMVAPHGMQPIKVEEIANPENWRRWSRHYSHDFGEFVPRVKRWSPLFVRRSDLEELERRLGAAVEADYDMRGVRREGNVHLITAPPMSASVDVPSQGDGIRADLHAALAQLQLGDRQDWRLHEVLLWIGLRDPRRVGEFIAATGKRWEQETGSRVEAELSLLFHPEGGTNWEEHPPAERFPATALKQALRAELLSCTGTSESGLRDEINPLFFVDRNPGDVADFRAKQTDVLSAWPALEAAKAPEADEAAADAWTEAFMSRPKWSLGEVIAWVGLRHRGLCTRTFGPGAYWVGALNVSSDIRLSLLLAALEHESEAHDRFPGPALERAVQRQGLLAAGVAPGGHTTHNLQDLIGVEFWREDVQQHFPELTVSAEHACQARLEDRVRAGGARKRSPEKLREWLVLLGRRPTKTEVIAQATLAGWSVEWARSEYRHVCDELSYAKRGRGERPLS